MLIRLLSDGRVAQARHLGNRADGEETRAWQETRWLAKKSVIFLVIIIYILPSLFGTAMNYMENYPGQSNSYFLEFQMMLMLSQPRSQALSSSGAGPWDERAWERGWCCQFGLSVSGQDQKLSSHPHPHPHRGLLASSWVKNLAGKMPVSLISSCRGNLVTVAMFSVWFSCMCKTGWSMLLISRSQQVLGNRCLDPSPSQTEVDHSCRSQLLQWCWSACLPSRVPPAPCPLHQPNSHVGGPRRQIRCQWKTQFHVFLPVPEAEKDCYLKYRLQSNQSLMSSGADLGARGFDGFSWYHLFHQFMLTLSETYPKSPENGITDIPWLKHFLDLPRPTPLVLQNLNLQKQSTGYHTPTPPECHNLIIVGLLNVISFKHCGYWNKPIGRVRILGFWSVPTGPKSQDFFSEFLDSQYSRDPASSQKVSFHESPFFASKWLPLCSLRGGGSFLVSPEVWGHSADKVTRDSIPMKHASISTIAFLFSFFSLKCTNWIVQEAEC